MVIGFAPYWAVQSPFFDFAKGIFPKSVKESGLGGLGTSN